MEDITTKKFLEYVTEELSKGNDKPLKAVYNFYIRWYNKKKNPSSRQMANSNYNKKRVKNNKKNNDNIVKESNKTTKQNDNIAIKINKIGNIFE